MSSQLGVAVYVPELHPTWLHRDLSKYRGKLQVRMLARISTDRSNCVYR